MFMGQDDESGAWTRLPVGHLAFVVMERSASSHDALNDRYIPFAGPIDPANPNMRYAMFTWDYFSQQWLRDGDGGFHDADLAQRRADQIHRELVAKWQIGSWRFP